MKNKKTIRVMVSIFTAIAMALILYSFSIAGSLEPPKGAVDVSGDPVSTMKTLDQIPPTWSQNLPANKRFEKVLTGTAILDKETGLVWAWNANLDGLMNWYDAMAYCHRVSIADRRGWRLPTIEELMSLVDGSRSDPALPDGHPFTNVQFVDNYPAQWDLYWTSTENESDVDNVWTVQLSHGTVHNIGKNNLLFVWPVRGGK
jgi:Protein of unknown function (DUF1566)